MRLLIQSVIGQQPPAPQACREASVREHEPHFHYVDLLSEQQHEHGHEHRHERRGAYRHPGDAPAELGGHPVSELRHPHRLAQPHYRRRHRRHPLSGCRHHRHGRGLTAQWHDEALERDHAGKPHPLGLSLDGLESVIESAGGREVVGDQPTYLVKANVVLPATVGFRSADGTAGTMAEWVQSQMQPKALGASGAAAVAPLARPATVFVSHSYGASFALPVDTLSHWQAQQEAHGDAGPYYYYIDLLSVPQHGKPAKIDFVDLRREYGSSVRSIGRLVLFLDWPDRAPLTRAWCIFEIFMGMVVGADFSVAMPPAHGHSFQAELLQQAADVFRRVCAVNTKEAKAQEPEDLTNIQKLVESFPGSFRRVDAFVVAAMHRWIIESGVRAALAQFRARRRLQAEPEVP